MLATHRAAFEDTLRRAGWPLVGLAEPAPFPRLVGDADISDGHLERVGLLYGDPMRPDGPLVQVLNARWDPSRVRPPGLRELLMQELDRFGDESPVQGAPRPGELVVDGEPIPAAVLDAGPRLWAASCAHRGVEVTVVARDWDPASTRLVTVADVEPFLQGRRERW